MNKISETKNQTSFINGKIVSLNLWWLCILPAIVTCVFTAAASFLTLNYEYLPPETDFLSGLFYDVSYIALDAALCLCLGAFCYAVYKKNILSSVFTTFVILFDSILVPMIMFFVRSIFLASVSSSDIMEEYFSVDVYVAVANILKMSAAILIILIVRASLFFAKKEKPLARPALAPKSEPMLCALVMTLANLTFTTLSFTFAEEYDFISLGMQVAFTIASYFIIALGVYFANKKCEKTAK